MTCPERITNEAGRVASLRPPDGGTNKRLSFERLLSAELTGKASFERAVEPLLGSNRRFTDGKNPMKFGILQTTLKCYDPQGRIAAHVRDLDQAGAKEIYRRIWERAGAGTLPEPLATVHFYSYVQRPQTAVEALKRSGLDPAAYVRERREALHRAGAASPEMSAWDRRIEGLVSGNADPPRVGELAQLSVQPVSYGPSMPAGKPRPYKEADRFDEAFAFVIRQEGSKLVRNDNGRGPSRFGILQSTLREYDPEGKIAQNVRDLDESRAKLLYRKIWERAGCDRLSHPLSVVHFDTYVHRPRTALDALRISEGSIDLYLRKRQNDLRSLPSYKRFGTGWENRIQRLHHYVQTGDTGVSYSKA